MKPRVLPKARHSPLTGASGKSLTSSSVITYDNSIASHGTARLLALVSAGPIDGLVAGAQSIFFDDIPLQGPDGVSNFSDVSVSFATGAEASNPHQLPGFGQTEQAQPIAAPLPHGVRLQYSHEGAHAVRVILRLPYGLYVRDRNLVAPAKVTIRLSVLRDGVFHTEIEDEIYEKQTGAFEKDYLIHLPQSEQRPTIRVEKLTPEDGEDSPFIRHLQLAALSWINWDRLRYEGLATIALSFGSALADGRIPRLSLEVRGRHIALPEGYDATTRTYPEIWNGRFVRGWSDNPAWVIYDLLTDPHYGLALPQSAIAIFDLYMIARHCDEMLRLGDGTHQPRHSFNAVLRARRPAADIIAEICAAIRAVFFWSGGVLHFVQDKEAAPVRLVNSRNVEHGKFTYSGQSRKHRYSHARVTFADAANRGAAAVESAFDPVAHAAIGFRPLEVSLLGCTNRSEAARHAKWVLETSAQSLHSVSYVAGLDHFTDDPVRPGDIIRLADSALSENKFHSRQLLPLSILPDAAFRDRSVPTNGDYHAIESLGFYGWYGCYFEDVEGGVTQAVLYISEEIYLGRYQLCNTFLAWTRPDAQPYSTISLYHIYDDKRTIRTGLYKVTHIREIAPQKVEVTAILYNADRFAYDHDAPLPEANQPPFLTAGGARPAAVTGLKSEQFDIWEGGAFAREICLTWHAPAATDSHRWQVVAQGPDEALFTQIVTRPKACFSALAAGSWQVIVTPIPLQRQRGVPARLDITITPEAAALPAPAAPLITSAPGQLHFDLPLPDIAGGISQFALYHTTSPNTPSDEAAHQLVMMSPSPHLALPVSTTESQAYLWRYHRPSGEVSPVSAVTLAAPLPLPQDGRDGADGKDGADGMMGPTGPAGPQGEDGQKGEKGEQGEKGDQGDRGDKGDKGDKGSKGERGYRGFQGDRGHQGEKGEVGDQGDKGEKGDRGHQGNKGDQGEKGETGDQGVQGPLGPTGPLGPKGERGYRGYRGYKGDQGQAGQTGPRGSLILKHLITGTSWQEAAARNAITAEAARPPLVGDIVTLANPEAGYHETRRYDGADFSTSADILSGDALIAGTVAARHLSLDGTSLTAHPHTGALQVAAISADQITGGVFRSPNYQPAQSGFAIATSGHAEFNEVHLRGRLTSSEIEASHIHAPAITLATAAGGRFRTHFLPRPVRAGLITHAGTQITAGPLRITGDDHSHFFGDEARDILAAHDRSGDNAAADRNAYYHRFRARAPALTVHLSFTQSATSWGRHIKSVGLRFRLRAGAKTLLPTTTTITPGVSFITNSLVSFSASTDAIRAGCEGPITVAVTRVHAPRPGYSAALNGCTSSYEMTATLRPICDPAIALTHDPLRLDIFVTPSLSGLATSQLMSSFAQSARLTATSLS